MTRVSAEATAPASPVGEATVRTVVAISAGHSAVSSTGRLAALLAEAGAGELRLRGVRCETDHLELRTIAADVVASLVDGVVRPTVSNAIATVHAADALVIVTPTINASFSGLLKTFLDVLPPDALRSVPTTIAATGGTSRHTLMLDQALRPMLGYQRAVVLPCCLYVTAEEWDGPRPGRQLAARIETAGRELAAFALLDAVPGVRARTGAPWASRRTPGSASSEPR